MNTPTADLIIQIAALSALCAPYLLIFCYLLYRFNLNRERAKTCTLKNDLAKANAFSLQEFKGDNANLATNLTINHHSALDMEYVRYCVEMHLQTIEQLQRTVERLEGQNEKLQERAFIGLSREQRLYLT